MRKLVNSMFFIAIFTLPCSISAHEGEDHDHDEAAEDTSATNQESGIGWKLIRSLEMGNSGKFVHMVLVDHAVYTDKTVYSAAINRLCRADDEFCRIRFWSQEKYIPEKASLTTEQNKHLRADYLVNKSAGMQHLRWSCSVDPDKAKCF